MEVLLYVRGLDVVSETPQGLRLKRWRLPQQEANPVGEGPNDQRNMRLTIDNGLRYRGVQPVSIEGSLAVPAGQQAAQTGASA